ncbi:hypothetical protein B0H11DRAFT_786575 [Mycena galericulata]|nr:hypothetical protein B0H11DRAFT_786575 [Mycena galericulata]
MCAPSALQLQELCDSITEFLHESPSDLKSCALVSSTFTSAAQNHLFRDIIFNRGCSGIDGPELEQCYDEAPACRRFCDVLKTSPHLIPLVRRLRLSPDHGVLSPLCELQFPNLWEIVLHLPRVGNFDDSRICLVSKLLSTPALVRAGLIFVTFRSTQDISRIFQHCPSTFNSLSLTAVYIKSDEKNDLLLVSTYARSKIRALGAHLLAQPECLAPFDLSALEELDCGRVVIPIVLDVLAAAHLTIFRLTIDAQIARTRPALLRNLPALMHLTIVSQARPEDVETLLEALPAGHRLATLVVKITKRSPLDMESVRRLGTTCASLTVSVGLHFQRLTSMVASELEELEVVVRKAFAQFDARGDLQFVIW